MEGVLNHEEQGFLNMVAVAALLQATSKRGIKYMVRDVYLDYGQDWMWTTIVSRGAWECQVLTPREWREIVLADTMEELVSITHDIQNGKYFGDK